MNAFNVAEHMQALGLQAKTAAAQMARADAATKMRALKALARRLRTGQVVINGAPLNLMAPFGGYKMSGLGREYGRYGLEEFFEVKSLQGAVEVSQ